MAIASLVCSLLGWLFTILFGWRFIVGPVLGLMFGFLALNQIKQTGQRGRGLAIAGIVNGGLLIALITALAILRAVVKHSPSSHSGEPAPGSAVVVVEPRAVSPFQPI